MASATVTARLKFLDASAHHYSTLAPATSAHLMLERMTVATENEIAPPKGADPNVACGACGTIRIPGWTSRITINDRSKSKVSSKTKKRRSSATVKCPAEKHVVVECLTCHRKTTTPMQSSRGHRFGRPRIHNAASTSGTISAEPALLSAPKVGNQVQISPNPVSVNISSKKRAKTRKQSGLQAMLDKSKGTGSSSGFGFDLMDFMKQA